MKTALAVCLAALTACATVKPAPLMDAEVTNAASDALAGFVESWNHAAAGDVQAPARYGNLYWPDAELVDPSGRIWNGQPAIQQMHVDLWHTAFKGSNVKGSVRKTRRLSPTSMIADFDLDLALFKGAPSGGTTPTGAPKPVSDSGKILVVLRKQPDGSWLRVADAWNSDVPPPAFI